MCFWHGTDDGGDKRLAGSNQFFQCYGLTRHPFKSARKFWRQRPAGWSKDFSHWTVVADKIDNEGAAQFVADALVRE